MSAAEVEHRLWVNVMSMLLGKTPEEVEAGYQRVKREHPEVAADLTAPVMAAESPALPSKASARVYPHERVSDSDLAELLAIEARARDVGLTYDEATAYQARLSGCARGLLIEVGATRRGTAAALAAWERGDAHTMADTLRGLVMS